MLHKLETKGILLTWSNRIMQKGKSLHEHMSQVMHKYCTVQEHYYVWVTFNFKIHLKSKLAQEVFRTAQYWWAA